MDNPAFARWRILGVPALLIRSIFHGCLTPCKSAESERNTNVSASMISMVSPRHHTSPDRPGLGHDQRAAICLEFFPCFLFFFLFFPVFSFSILFSRFFPPFFGNFYFFFCNFSRWFLPSFFPVFLVFFVPLFLSFFHRFIYFSLLFFFPLVFSRFFSTILLIFPFLGFDCFNWYLQHFAIKLSDLHGACYIWSLDPPGAWYFEYQGWWKWSRDKLEVQGVREMGKIDTDRLWKHTK